MGKDYYAILGISRDADDDTIKKAYRKLGNVLQPDMCASQLCILK